MKLSCGAYQIKINGKQVFPDFARVSAVPFNRRWPGHQIGIEQSEVINFVNFATDGKSEFEIIPEKPFEKVDIRPKSLGITPVVTADGVIKFTIDKNAYFTVEPYGRNDALHVFVDKQKEYDVNINAENISLKWDEWYEL